MHIKKKDNQKSIWLIIFAFAMAILISAINAGSDSGSETQSISEWTMFGRDLNNTRYYPNYAPSNISSTPYTNFTHSFSGSPSSTPIISGGFIYVGSTDNKLYQINASNLSQTFATFTAGDDVSSSAAIAYGYVYIGSDDYKLYQLNASNVSQHIANFTTAGIIRSQPAVVNGYVYFGTGATDENIYQLNASNVSQKIANYSTGGYIFGSPSVVGEYVYTGSSSSNIYQFNASNVSQLFASKYIGPFASYGYTSVANGYVYIGTGGGRVFQLNASNVSQLFASYTTGSGSIQSGFAVANGYVYYGTASGGANIFYQLNASNVSQKITSYDYGYGFDSTPAVTSKYVYVGNWNSKVLQFDANNISNVITIFSLPTGGVYGGITIANSYVYVVNSAFAIFKFGSINPIARVVYPIGNPDGTNQQLVNFNCSAEDSIGLQNISLFITDNTNSSFSLNQSAQITGNENSSNWTLNLAFGNYTVNCLAYDSDNNSDWDENKTFYVDNISPNVVLNSPNYTYNDSGSPININFNCSATDNIPLKNISLFITDNTNSSFSLNSTTSLTGTSSSANWTLRLTNGNYTWNCLAYDLASNSNWSSNMSLVINYTDIYPPIINITYPANNTNYTINVSRLNYTASDGGTLDKCWWSNSSGIWNSTNVSAGVNWTNLASVEGWNNWTVYCNDSASNIGSAVANFYKDTLPPSFVNVTNQTLEVGNALGYQLNATDASGISCFTVNDTTKFNINCSGWLKNNTYLNASFYRINITVNDTYNNRNSALMSINITDTTAPNISIVYPQNTNYNTNISALNYSATDFGILSRCWYSNSSGIWNSSSVAAGTNWTGLNSTEGWNNWTVYCNDTFRNIGSKSVAFLIDLTAPQINFTAPTQVNGTITKTTSAEINISIQEQNLKSLIYNWNSTNFTIYDDSLVLMMNFENLSALGENDTRVSDLSKYGNNGTVSGAVWNSSGKYGGAYSFDGADDYVYVSDSDILDNPMNNFAFSFWFKTNGSSSGTYAGVLMKGVNANGGKGYGLIIGGTSYPGQLQLNFGNETSRTQILTTSSYNNNQWHNILAIFNRTGNMSLYIDGIKYSTEADISGSASVDISSTSNLLIGNREANIYFNGSIDEVRIWNRSLSADEVYQQYISNLYKFNQTQWQLYVNQSKNATTGLGEGQHTYQAYVSDIASNQNQTEIRTLTVDTTYPQIEYASNSEQNGANISRSNIFVNVSVTETNFANISFTLNNNSATINTTFYNSSIYFINWTGLANGNYTYYVNITDLANNMNSTSLRIATIDTSSPNATLISPPSSSYSGISSPNFTANISDNRGIKNASFWIYNATGSLINVTWITDFASNTLNAIVGIVVYLADGVYTWFYKVFDYAGNIFTTENRTITIDTLTPGINIIYPQNNINYTLNISELNYTLVEINENSCWWSNSSGIWNSSSVTAGTNFTNLTSIEGWNNWSVYCNDSANNTNSSYILFFKDSINPGWSENKTSLNSSVPPGTSVYFNITLSDANPGRYIFSWYNGTIWSNDSSANYTNGQEISITKTINANGRTINWRWYFNDSLGNTNQSSLFSVQLDINDCHNSSITPIPLCTCNDLNKTRLNLTANYTLQNNIDCSITTNWSSGFLPIGTSGNEFQGRFNGRQYNITNLFINRNSTSYVGLFGSIKNAQVYNFSLIDVNITGSSYVGAAVGYINTLAQLSRVYSNGSVSSNSDYIGGLVGFIYSTGNITYSGSSARVSGSQNVGGLVGKDDEAYIGYSYATGNISGDYMTGGFVGYNEQGTITFSYATGDILGDRNLGANNNASGGFAGYGWYGLINNSYATGNVRGGNYLGGFMGECSESCIFNNCFSRGTVNGSGTRGSFMGYGYHPTIKNSYATGFVNGMTEAGFIYWDFPSGCQNNFFDNETTNQTLAGTLYDNTAATPKTTIQMKNISTYTKLPTTGLTSPWDFAYNPYNDTANNEIWQINETVNDGYPFLIGVGIGALTDVFGPVINITSPRNNTNYANITAMNYSLTDLTGAQSCWWSNSSGIWNSSSVTAGTNFTNLTSIEGWNNWSVYCNDSYNNLGQKITVFYIDTVLPVFNNLTNQTTTNVVGLNYQINATDAYNISCFTVNDTANFNINCSGRIKNNTVLSAGLFWLNISASDTSGNVNYALMFVNVSDAIPPIFNNLTNRTIMQNESLGYQINTSDDSGVSCFALDDTANFNINCSGWLRNNTRLVGGAYQINVTVNDTSNNRNSALMFVIVNSISMLNLTLISPTENINVNQSDVFNVSVNISCLTADCGAINVSLDPEQYPSYTFTTCGQTGMLGPNQAQCNANYTGTTLNEKVAVFSGYQNFTIPVSGQYTIDTRGAQGGVQPEFPTAAKGARIVGTFSLNAGDILIIVVGQVGENATGDMDAGGGGGSYVVLVNSSSSYNISGGVKVTPLIIAGGGGGSSADGAAVGGSATTSSTGTYVNSGNGVGGTSGTGGGGGGFVSNGISQSGGIGGQGFLNGSRGGNSTADGGFGGGAGGFDENGAGGGGWNGGNGYDTSSGTGGGGSYNIGTSQTNLSANNSGQGLVIITQTSGRILKTGLVSMNSSETPFYTTTQNPYNLTLNNGQSQIVTWAVNATGSRNDPYTFFAYANLTSNLSIGSKTNSFNVTIMDVVSPVFNNLTNQTIEYKSLFSYQINTTDSFGISCFTVNDTTNFNVNCSGYLRNNTALNVSFYLINITVNDTSNNRNSALMFVNVSDTIAPVINITYPINNSNYTANVSNLNYTVNDNSSLSRCWWSNSSGIWNSSSVTAGTNFTNLTSIEGWNNWSVYCNDSYNNLGSRTNRFFKDSILPVFNNLTNQTITDVSGLYYQINATDSNSISCFTVNDTTKFNINCSGYLRNNTVLSGGLYWLNITVNDTLNNRNSVLMFVNVSDTTLPVFNNLTNQTIYQERALNYQINATDISGISCFTVNDTTNFNVNCSGYLRNNTALNVSFYLINITVNDTSNNRNSALMFVNVTPIPRIGLALVSPTGNINVTQNRTFTVSVNVSCSNTNCEAVNVSLDPSGITLQFNYTGSYQNWTVPEGVTSAIINVSGAQGGYCTSGYGPGGLGARMTGTFNVISGQVLWILVGQQPTPGPSSANGGGGGSFVANGTNYSVATPLIVAGGGGGSATSISSTINATNSTSGQNAYSGGTGGTEGNGSSSSSGGAGFYTNGGSGAKSFRNGGTGASGSSNGGFGGGGYGSGCANYGGGGGGYSGGGGSSNSGGGGGSFNSGTNQVNLNGINAGNGVVTITYMTGKGGLVSMNSSETPFYTTTQNPYNLTLNVNESAVITWTVNATGTPFVNYPFFVYANKTSDTSINNITLKWNVTIVNFSTTDTVSVNVTYPLNNTNYTINTSQLNYTVSSLLGLNLSSCWYSNSSGIWNSSSVSAGTNFTGLTSAEGWNNWSVYCNDTSGNIGSSFINFYKDSILPNLTLNSPSESYSNSTPDTINITFNCSASDNLALRNISLFITNSSNGNFALNRTANITGTSNSTNWTLSLGVGNYTWNCLAFDSLGNSNLSANRTIIISYLDIAFPAIGISYPVNNANYTFNISTLNYSASDNIGVNYCWWSNSSGIWNSSSVAAGTNFTGLTSVESWNNWSVYCNDSSGNVNFSAISFYKDDISPSVALNLPADNYTLGTFSLANITFNCSASDNLALRNISLFITNSSNGNFALNKTANITGTSNSTNWTLSLGVGNYTWNCLAFDSLGNSNLSANRTISLQTNIAPNVTLNFPENNSRQNKINSILLNASIFDANGYLNNLTIWFYGGYPNGTYSLINVAYNQTSGANLTFNWTLGISGRYNWTVLAGDGLANSTNYYFYFNLTNFSISCEAGGPYQQNALVLIQGTVLNESIAVPSYPVNLSIYDLNSNLDASQNLTTASDGGFETSFANLSVGSYTLNATSSYLGYNEICRDSFQIGSPASLILDKTITFFNQTNAIIIYNISLIITNKGGSEIVSAVLTDSDSNVSQYNLENLSANSSTIRSYLKEFNKNSSAYSINLSVANVNGTSSYSGNEISVNSTQIMLSIPAEETGQQLTLVKNAYYNSENSTSINYTLTLKIINSGGSVLLNITVLDSDLNLNTLMDLNRTQSYNYSSSLLIEKAASNTNKLFAKTTATANSVTYESNQIQVRIPGFGGPADVIVYAPASVSSSTSFQSTISIINQNPDIGQDFVIDYWITNDNENTNYTSGQQTIYVAASGQTNATAILSSPSAAGNYKLRALTSWAGGTASAYDSFSVAALANTEAPSTTAPSGGSTIIINKTEEKKTEEIVCNSPYIRYGKECCLDKNNNNICDTDESIPAKEQNRNTTETIKEGEKADIKLTQENLTSNYSLEIINLQQGSIEVLISSQPVSFVIGEEKRLDLDNDGSYDLYIKLNKIENGEADIYFETIGGEIKVEKQRYAAAHSSKTSWIFYLVIFLIVFLVAVICKYFLNKKRCPFIKNQKIRVALVLVVLSLKQKVMQKTKSTLNKLWRSKRIKHDGKYTSLNDVRGLEVFSLNGQKIGKIKDICLEDKNPKIYGWIVRMEKKIAKKIKKKEVLIKQNCVENIGDVMVVDEKVLEHLQ